MRRACPPSRYGGLCAAGTGLLLFIGCVLLVLAGYVWDQALIRTLKTVRDSAQAVRRLEEEKQELAAKDYRFTLRVNFCGEHSTESAIAACTAALASTIIATGVYRLMWDLAKSDISAA